MQELSRFFSIIAFALVGLTCIFGASFGDSMSQSSLEDFDARLNVRFWFLPIVCFPIAVLAQHFGYIESRVMIGTMLTAATLSLIYVVAAALSYWWHRRG